MQSEVDRAIAEMAPEYDVVIAADFGHGIIAKSSIDALTRNSRFLAVNTQSNSANLGFNLITRYERADYICIDLPEARLAVSDRLSVAGDIARRLIEDMVDCSKIIVTQGKHGCVTLERGGVVHTIPAFAKNVVDTVGAGDAFLAVPRRWWRRAGRCIRSASSAMLSARSRSRLSAIAARSRNPH